MNVREADPDVKCFPHAARGPQRFGSEAWARTYPATSSAGREQGKNPHAVVQNEPLKAWKQLSDFVSQPADPKIDIRNLLMHRILKQSTKSGLGRTPVVGTAIAIINSQQGLVASPKHLRHKRLDSHLTIPSKWARGLTDRESQSINPVPTHLPPIKTGKPASSSRFFARRLRLSVASLSRKRLTGIGALGLPRRRRAEQLPVPPHPLTESSD